MAKHYKMKTNRAAAKRFHYTAGGKLKRKKAGLRHFMRRKSTRAKRNLRNRAYMSEVDVPEIRVMLPYGMARRKGSRAKSQPYIAKADRPETNVISPNG